MVYEVSKPQSKEIQWSDLGTTLVKIKDTLVKTQDSLEEINLGTDKEPRITYISGLLPNKPKLKIKELLKE